jgi:hypothetical protein
MSDTSSTTKAEVKATPVVETPAATTPKKSGGKSPVVLILGILLVVCLLVLCCGGIFFAANAAANSASGSLSNSLSDLATKGAERAVEEAIKSEGGPDTNVSFGSNAKLPENFPSDVPVFTPSSVLTSYSSKEGGKTNYSVTLTTKNTTVDAIVDFYRTQLASNGWNITTESDFFLKSLIAEKDGRDLTVSFLDTQDAETGVSIIISSTKN